MSSAILRNASMSYRRVDTDEGSFDGVQIGMEGGIISLKLV